jgi:serine/threonine protein kinase/Tol biopolymer transport system component
VTLAPGTRLGSYEVLAPLGAGGMGEVYRARDTKLGRDVALKILPQSLTHDPDRIARFTREAQVLASLNHPNIGAIYGLDEANDQQFLVLELIEGETLADRVATGAISVDEALAIARQIAEALEAAHEQGIIHRDLKPANIKVRPDGTVKVLDFGLAKLTESQAASAASALLSQSPTITTPAMMTSMGVILGTAAYMSPEQASGKTADRRADIWGFGAVLYEMLAGTRAFAGESVPDTLATVLKVDPNWAALPRSTPASIRTLVQRCLEKDRKKRLQAIGEARITIEDTLNAQTQRMESQAEGVRHPIRRAWPWVAIAALSIALAAVSLLHFREVPPPDRSVRFQVPLPEKSIVGNFQLSPDGAYLAFTGGKGAGRLWVRPLDGLEAQALPGTDGARLPFWSPDSAFIGFFAQGKLKKISVTGGPVQTLCDARNTRGGAWNRDGVILVVPPNSLTINRVSAEGGTPTPVTKAVTGELQVFPQFLPGGRQFFYASRGNKAGAEGVYVGSLDGPSRRILPNVSRAAYVPPRTSGHTGYLVFSQDATVMAQPFDPDRLQLTGNAIPIAERASGAPLSEFSVSENGALAYVSGEGSRELIWTDRAGKPLDSADPTGVYAKFRQSTDDLNFRLSPDDKRVAFDRGDRGNRDIWVLDMLRGVTSRLTSGPAVNNLPAWSPDGLRVLFPSNRNGGFDLYVKSATGAGQEDMLQKMGTPTGWGTDWSRDGRYILYQIPGAQTGQDLWVAPQFGDRKPYPYLQTQADEQEGRFAPGPEGVPHWVAYVSDETGRDEIYVQAFPPSLEKKRISTGGGSEPFWRSDGTELFYLGGDGMLMAVPIRVGTTIDAGLPKNLFPVLAIASRRNYAVAGDGQRFLVFGAVGDVAPITVVLNWQVGLKK